jgi:hypothetical protein
MVSPVIDEDVMIDTLKQIEPEKLPENTMRLRTGASLLLLDAYDRKVTRDQFIAALGSSLDLVDMLGRFEMMNNVKSFREQAGRVTGADIEVTLASVTSKVNMYTDQCSKMAELVQQCPLSEDSVH